MHLNTILTGLAVGNIVLTFLVQWYVMITLGPGDITDAYIAAQTIPMVILSIVAASLPRVLVPILATTDVALSTKIALSVSVWTSVVFAMISVALYITAGKWVAIVFPGFSGEKELLAIELARIQLIGMVFIGLSSVFTAINHARSRFYRSEAAGIALNVVAFLAILWLLPRYGIVAVAWLGVVRVFLYSVILMPIRDGFSRLDFSEPQLLLVWRRLRPLLFGSAVYKFSPLIDRYLASTASAGMLSLLSVGQIIYGAGLQVLERSSTVIMVPALSRHSANADWSAFRTVYRNKLWVVLGGTGVAALLLVSIGQPLLGVFFEYGKMERQDIETLWWIMVGFLGIGFGGASGQIIASSFYALGDTRTPTRIGLAGFAFGLILRVAGFFVYGIFGLVISTSIYYVLNATVMGLLLERRLDNEILSRAC